MSLPTTPTGPFIVTLPTGVTGGSVPEEVKVCAVPEDGEFNSSNIPPGLTPFSPDCGPLPFPTINTTGPRPPLTEIAGGVGNPWFYSQSELQSGQHWANYPGRMYPNTSHADAIAEGANALSLDYGHGISIGKNSITSSGGDGFIGYVTPNSALFRSNIRYSVLLDPSSINAAIHSIVDPPKEYNQDIPYGSSGDYDSGGGSIAIGGNSHSVHDDYSGIDWNSDAGAAIAIGKDTKSANAIVIGTRAKAFAGITIGHRSGGARGVTDRNGSYVNPSISGAANIIIGHQIYPEDNPEDGPFKSVASHAGGAFNILIGGRMLTYASVAARSNVLIGSTTLTTYYSFGPENSQEVVNNFSAITPITGNTAVGMLSLHNIKNANYNTSVGYNSGYNNFGGHNNTCVGANTLPAPSLLGRPVFPGGYDVGDVTNVTCLGYGTDVSNNNQVQLGNSATTTYAYGAVQNRSDRRDKSDIRVTQLGLSFINKLTPVDFKWEYREDYKELITSVTVDDKGEEQHSTKIIEHPRNSSKKRNRYHHGLIAQDVKEVIDELGIDFGGYQDHSVTGGADILSIGYQELIAPLIKAVQELSEKVNSLENELKTLKDDDNK